MNGVRSLPMEGVRFIPPEELNLPDSRLSRSPYNFNNHHMAWPAKRMGRLILTQTFRDLTRNQVILPKDVHCELHRRFSPPDLSDLHGIWSVIHEAREMNETLRYGPASRSNYVPIPDKLLFQVDNEYRLLTNGAA